MLRDSEYQLAARGPVCQIQCAVETEPRLGPAPGDVMRTTLMVLLTIPLFAVSASAQGRAGGSDSAQAARQAAANKPRTIAGINSVWIEELTQPEFRDMIKDGYTTVLILTGGVEDNSANLVMTKHNINNRLLSEMLARKMGKTLVAPLVTL